MQVIEARDRIGGRIWSPPLGGEGGAIVDLGASWIHGIGRGKKENDPKGLWKNAWNPVYQLARENKLETHSTWKEDYVNIYEVWYNPDGTTYLPPRFWKLHDRIKEYFTSGKNHK